MINQASSAPDQVIPVILCGGSGTRLWPLSRSGFPKQFLIFSGDGSGKSLFQLAVERLNAIGPKDAQLGETLIITNEDHRFLVLDQLREIPSIAATLLLEPEESKFIPQGQAHRLSNPGSIPLENASVQLIGNLGEDDIICFEDSYG